MRTYAQQKAGLTRAMNSKNFAKLVAECKRVIVEWEDLPYGWPDDWHRWNIALADGYSHVRHEYIQGRESTQPVYVDMNDLRWQVATEQTESKKRKRGDLLKEHLGA